MDLRNEHDDRLFSSVGGMGGTPMFQGAQGGARGDSEPDQSAWKLAACVVAAVAAVGVVWILAERGYGVNARATLPGGDFYLDLNAPAG